MKKIFDAFKILLELTKFKITSFVTVTTFLGYVLYTKELRIDLIGVLMGVLLFSGGSAVINHYQERNFDALMRRTRNRPIPSGKVNSKIALALGILFALGGFIILYIGFNLTSALFGLLALVWYNLIYTPLKRKFALAVVPGSLIGSIPPIIGWTAAGGYPFDNSILVIAFFLFIWQIPHFWLLMLFFDDDYKAAGYPTLTSYFSKEQVFRLTFIWMIALGVASLVMPLFNLVNHPVVNYGLLLTAIWLIWNSSKLIRKNEEKLILISGFRTINTFVLLIVFQLSLDKLL
ncbi:MAG: heme o synthase [Ignavibacteria bacterium]|jgi:protoheme IX farnesyltransferase|nr:heme o synthase [Ignavibacteria bacterium]MDH7528733.1 heme o synthase [Ignavibacteria bacterium]NPV10231.1 protoheme IX farnesyltransferase [Ignavibacteria bacterium]